MNTLMFCLVERLLGCTFYCLIAKPIIGLNTLLFCLDRTIPCLCISLFCNNMTHNLNEYFDGFYGYNNFWLYILWPNSKPHNLIEHFTVLFG
jgi:hypothetical protein